MPFVKILSDQVPRGYLPIRAGHHISWHFAMFEDLMTEKSRMLGTSFLTGIESGTAGTLGPNDGWSKWLLRDALSKPCFLGEKSIWKWSEESRDLVCFVEVVQQDNIPSPTRGKSDIAAAKVKDFGEKVRDEVRNLVGFSDLDKQLKFDEGEILEFSCACFKDYWVDQDSALLDTTFSHGELELIIIRRGWIQGWWALALRQLGQLVRIKMESKGKKV